MKKSKKIVFYSLILTILVVAGIAIWFSTLEKWEPPVRPKSVPQDAIWAGGYDGGCFFLLQSEYSDTSRFTVYEEHNGDIWYDGLFSCGKKDFECIAKSEWSNLLKQYNGQEIVMTNPEDKSRHILWHPIE